MFCIHMPMISDTLKSVCIPTKHTMTIQRFPEKPTPRKKIGMVS